MSYSCCDYYEDVMDAVRDFAKPAALEAADEALIANTDNLGPLAEVAKETIADLAEGEAAACRLARMVLAPRESVSPNEMAQFAREVLERHSRDWRAGA